MKTFSALGNRQAAVLLLGPTGSGKTPLGQLLERAGLWGCRCLHFDFGDSLRRAAGGLPSAGLAEADVAVVAAALRTGELLDDSQFHIARNILLAFLLERQAGAGDLLVLNGLPRHAGQARDMTDLVDVRHVVCLVCTPEVAAERIRLNAGGDRAGREDDSCAAVRQRLELFQQRTAPMLAHYAAAGARVLNVEVGVQTGAAEMRSAIERGGGF
jgi:adenylate kinase family enzyme